jgi:hypothetical protein
VEEVSLAKFAITMTNVEQEGRIIRSFFLMVFFFFFLFFFPSDYGCLEAPKSPPLPPFDFIFFKLIGY